MCVAVAVVPAVVGHAAVGHAAHAGQRGRRQEDDEGEELGALVQDLQALNTTPQGE